MSRERLAALCRLLIVSGDMTPMAERMLLAAHDDTRDGRICIDCDAEEGEGK